MSGGRCFLYTLAGKGVLARKMADFLAGWLKNTMSARNKANFMAGIKRMMPSRFTAEGHRAILT